MASIDSKFKEEQPLATVNRIRNALFNAGIFTVEDWTDSGVKGYYSVRIEIAGTHIGQNGKGVTREFALASGYAEFMERIQAGYLYVGEADKELERHRDFLYTPDEKEFTVDEYVSEYGDVPDKLKEKLGCSELKDFLKLCGYGSHLDPEKDFTALAFRKMSTGQRVYIPVPLLMDIYATNGTCAGNTKAEALVQGFSEIMERNHNLRILTELMTPPTIPEEYLQKFEAYSMIREIRKEGQCELIVKDCSLNTGFPVIASILISRKSHGYIVKFGAHPVFEIALERTLTEMLQGRNILDAGSTSALAYTESEVLSHDNIHNVLKNASGKYHYNFFPDKNDSVFVPFPDRTQMDNAGLYEYCSSLFQKLGLEVYIRKCGYLGFPSYQIIIPGYSEAYNYGIARLKEKNSLIKASEIIRKPADAGDRQLNTLFYYLRYKENFSMENTLSFTLRKPLMLTQAEDMRAYFHIELCIAVRLEKWNEVIHCARILEALETENEEFYSALKNTAKSRLAGNDKSQAAEAIEKLYSPEVISEISRITDWNICAKEITDYCRKVEEAENAYDIYRNIRFNLKKKQEEWFKSNDSIEL